MHHLPAIQEDRDDKEDNLCNAEPVIYKAENTAIPRVLPVKQSNNSSKAKICMHACQGRQSRGIVLSTNRHVVSTSKVHIDWSF